MSFRDPIADQMLHATDERTHDSLAVELVMLKLSRRALLDLIDTRLSQNMPDLGDDDDPTGDMLRRVIDAAVRMAYANVRDYIERDQRRIDQALGG